MEWTYHIDPDMDPIMTEGQGKLWKTFLVYPAELVSDFCICIYKSFIAFKLCFYCYFLLTLSSKSRSVLGWKMDQMPLLSDCRQVSFRHWLPKNHVFWSVSFISLVLVFILVF